MKEKTNYGKMPHLYIQIREADIWLKRDGSPEDESTVKD